MHTDLHFSFSILSTSQIAHGKEPPSTLLKGLSLTALNRGKIGAEFRDDENSSSGLFS